MFQGLIVSGFTVGLLAVGAYLLHQAGIGRTLTESALFVTLGIILLILTAATLGQSHS